MNSGMEQLPKDGRTVKGFWKKVSDKILYKILYKITGKLTGELSEETKANVKRKARAMTRKWHRMIGTKHMCIGALFFGLTAGCISYSGILEVADQMFSDMIYQSIATKNSNSQIRIIAVDEKTVGKYGKYEDWSREMTVRLLNRLNKSEDKKPAVIGLDLDYSEKKDSAGDQSLVKACTDYKNLCFSASVVTAEPVINLDQINGYGAYSANKLLETNEQLVTVIEQPFDDLLDQATIGIINNTRNSDDGFVRNAFSSVRISGWKVDSFTTAIYKKFMDYKGREYRLPKLDEDMSFQFTFSKRSHEYTVYSFCDVIEGKIAPEAFAGCMVLVGSFLNDQTFHAPNQRGTSMHEMDMQANLLEALLEQRTGQEASKKFMAVFYAFFMALLFIATSYSSVRLTVMIVVCVGVVQFMACWIVTLFGYYVNILVPLIMAVLIAVYNLIVRYIIAVQNQYAMEDVFKKYIDESVVSELVKDGRVQARIGVVRKDVAVLFVDIRGFTSLSEVLPPEQIVDILNAYLELVAQAVAKYRGTLDKFIGDAAMAVFNSPFDLEDYEFKAVCAALDLRASAFALNEKCKQEYGMQLAIGIGIQCGEAVIGNIGCERRMDYTAIGDTVNTASRLEGAAAPGQILISMEMEQRLRGRIQTNFAGEYTFKGKKCAVSVYAVEGIASAADSQSACREL